MKKLTAFVMIACLSMFCTLGCTKPADTTTPKDPAPVEKKDGDKEKTPAAPADKEAKTPAEKPADKSAE